MNKKLGGLWLETAVTDGQIRVTYYSQIQKWWEICYAYLRLIYTRTF